MERWGNSPLPLENIMKVTCIKSVTIGAMNLAFVEGKEYDIPAKDANAYSEYFEKMKTTPKNKAKKTEENK